MLLCYRADIVEAAGIDVSEIETWDDFERLLIPLTTQATGGGQAQRFLLLFDTNSVYDLALLMLQARGGTFGPDGSLVIASEPNAKVLARVV